MVSFYIYLAASKSPILLISGNCFCGKKKKKKNVGFSEVNSGCCGTGLIEGAFLCNRKSSVCSDASKNIFWDSVHPTEATYYYLFKALRPMVDVFLKD